MYTNRLSVTCILAAIMHIINLPHLTSCIEKYNFPSFFVPDFMTNILQIRFLYISSLSYAQFNLSKPHIVEDIWY